MSSEALGWAIGQVAGSPRDKLVLLTIADVACCLDDNGNTASDAMWHSSLDYLCRVTECSTAQVSAALRGLTKRGLIKVRDDGAIVLLGVSP